MGIGAAVIAGRLVPPRVPGKADITVMLTVVVFIMRTVLVIILIRVVGGIVVSGIVVFSAIAVPVLNTVPVATGARAGADAWPSRRARQQPGAPECGLSVISTAWRSATGA